MAGRALGALLLLVLVGCARERRPEAWFGVEPSSGAYAWLQELRTLYPDLSEASFRLSGSDPLQSGGEPWLRLWQDGASPEAIAVWTSLAEISPDGTRAVSLFFDNLGETESGWVVGGNPDEYIAVLPVDTWVGTAAFVCGPCSFQAAGWAGNDTIVVVGIYERGWEPPSQWILEVGVLDIGKGLVHWYHGPEVSPEMGGTIGARWHSWLRRRYSHVAWRRE